MDKQEPVAKFKVGDPVQRAEPRSYLFPGIVIGANLKLDGKTWLYSVECIAPGVEGMVHEFTERALEARANRPAEDKQEPVAWMYENTGRLELSFLPLNGREGTPLYTRATRPADDGLVEAVAELQLAAFLAGRGSVRTKDNGRTVTSLPGPTMDDYRRMAATALRAQSDAEVERDRYRAALVKAERALQMGHKHDHIAAEISQALERSAK